ncbi:asparaginyl beta-hydroxylase [Seminavis robusta]|uniref:Asparaginyl beta-hydroxylase n=1 Tax=Seminavis robusta TaxID=568900 RepID=A0A9N8DI91_9STRA|nr:asparaginyl beta-hydroxylase [Seminavis robusta]|eukprot:Sro103_g052430.1 asparaginyl beta-hydroxylase (389) ;mRNA; r:39246-40626
MILRLQCLVPLAVLLSSTDSFLLTSPPSSKQYSSARWMVAMEPQPASSLPDTSTPLPPHTFAGMVEQSLLEKFNEKDITRVLTSWRLLEKDYEHREYAGPSDLSPESSQCHQHCHSYVPGLSIRPFWDVATHGDGDWTRTLPKRYKEIREEFTRVALTDPDQLERQGNNIWAGALTEDASSYGVDWKTLVLCDRGVWDPVNVNLFPKTSKAVRDCGVPATEVFFASMKPNSSIKPHTDFTNFVLTSHLPLVIPESGNNKCRLTIGDETRQWIDGQLMLFDTSIMHDAINESDQMRYILMMRVWHPDLTPTERQALQHTYDCLNVPELVSSDPGERSLAERQVQAMHEFPAIQRAAAAPVGFGGGGGKQKKKSNKKNKKAKGATKGFGS